jgi:hypothetical protein
MPISRTVAPITDTITRLTSLIFSVFQILENHFIQDGESLTPKSFGVGCPFRESGLMFITSLATISVDWCLARNRSVFDRSS